MEMGDTLPGNVCQILVESNEFHSELRLVGTQEDQDKSDEQTKRKAMNDLVQSWMDRLQLISVIVRSKDTIHALLLTEPYRDVDYLLRRY